MKKLLLGLIGITAATLAGCSSNSDSDLTTIRIGATSTPHAEILEFANPLLEEKGYTLDITVFTDFVMPNLALDQGDLDANYFQHAPYLDTFNADNGTDIVKVVGVHVEPIGMYSQRHESLSDLPEGARIIMSNSVSDQGRMLTLLQSYGLITLDDSVDSSKATLDDIVENPHNFVFEANIEAGMLVQVYLNDEADAVLINTNFALDGGLNPGEDAIVLEDEDSPFANILAVNAGDENLESIQALAAVLQSEEVANFILETYNGAVVPVTK